MSHASHWVPELLLVGSYLHVDYRIIKLSFAVNNISQGMCFTPKAEVSLCWTAQFPARSLLRRRLSSLYSSLKLFSMSCHLHPMSERRTHCLPMISSSPLGILNSLSAHLNPVATGDKRRDQNRLYIWTADEKGTEHDLCHWRYTRKH